MAFEPGSFAAFTVAERLPAIIRDLTTDLPTEAASHSNWVELLDAVTRGGRIDVDLLAPTTRWWEQMIVRSRGLCWRDLPFFDLEFLFYHSINTIAGRLVPGHDVFLTAKRQALGRALAGVRPPVPEIPAIDAAIVGSLLGNVADLSQLERAELGDVGIELVIDQRAALRDALLSPPYSTLHLVADNAGAELVGDLLLAAHQLEHGWIVHLHVKPWPMFVSDATAWDVRETLLLMAEAQAEQLRDASGLLTRAEAGGHFFIQSAVDWGEPRHFDELSEDLTRMLNEGSAVLLKGDLNYRRAFGDLAWPSDTPKSAAYLAPELRAFALRILKSEIVVGIPSNVVAELDERDRDWRSNGRHGLVQELGRKSSP